MVISTIKSTEHTSRSCRIKKICISYKMFIAMLFDSVFWNYCLPYTVTVAFADAPPGAPLLSLHVYVPQHVESVELAIKSYRPWPAELSIEKRFLKDDKILPLTKMLYGAVSFAKYHATGVGGLTMFVPQSSRNEVVCTTATFDALVVSDDSTTKNINVNKF